MRIAVTLKDPDTMQDAVAYAMKREPKPAGISADEWRDIQEARADRIKSAISGKFMRYGEYLDVEFDVSEDYKTVTVQVLDAK